MPGSPSAISRIASVESINSEGTSSTHYSSQLENVDDIILAVDLDKLGEEPTQPVASVSVLESSGSSSGQRHDSGASYYYRAKVPGSGWDEAGLSDLGEHKPTPPTVKRKGLEDDDLRSDRPPKMPRAESESSRLPYSSIDGVIEPSNVLEPVVVTNATMHLGYLQRARWGVQWELARLATDEKGSYDGLSIQDLTRLSGLTNQEGAEEVAKVVRERRGGNPGASKDAYYSGLFESERAARDPWEELDKEEDFLRGLDPKETTPYLRDERTAWYGGKVHFTARLRPFKSADDLRIVLEKPQLGTSCRFTRRFGSHRFLRVRLDDTTIYDKKYQLVEYFQRPFVIGGFVFRAFYAKEHNVFLFRTNEVTGSTSMRRSSGPRDDMGLREFMEWHNNIALNSSQSMTKWSARFALGLSSSVPSVRLQRGDIEFVDDIISPQHSEKEGKAPSELIMTDGCGLANRDFFEALNRQFGWSYRAPTAVQVRIEGAKGLLMQHPDHRSISEDGQLRPRVWIRSSQRKIRYSESSLDDPALLTVDVLRASHLAHPSHLSSETIINIAENNVPSQAITNLIQDTLTKRVDGLTTWDGPDGCYRLWLNTAREGGVFAARRARYDVSEARVMGNVFDDDPTAGLKNEDDEGDVDGTATIPTTAQSSAAWYWDLISGSPSSLEETSMGLLDSGFSPDELPVLCAKQKEVAKKAIKATLNKFSTPVPMSCSAWSVPDPCGVLEPGEIYIESSTKTLVDQDGNYTDRVLGDVLVTRHPCKLPTDVQRAHAVDKIQLHGFTDVVIVSTKGHTVNGETLGRHLLSLMGGGDYDGDLVQVFWNPDLVKDFRSADIKYAEVPMEVDACLERSDMPVEDFRKSHESSSERLSALQVYLLGSLRNPSLVGKYSSYWETAMYKHGYSDPRTTRVAHVFCAVLDGSKTGVTVRKDQQRKDQKEYGNSDTKLHWKQPIDASNMTRDFRSDVVRDDGLGRFIMDKIRQDLVRIKDGLEKTISKRLDIPAHPKPDPDLIRPWEDFVKRAEQSNPSVRPDMLKLVGSIKERVEEFYKGCAELRLAKDKQRAKNSRSKFTDLPIEKRQDILREQSLKFRAITEEIREEGFSILDNDELFKYMASYVYLYDSSSQKAGWSRRPWNLAMGALCEIKARAVSKGCPKTATMDFYQRFTIHKKAIEDANHR